MSLYPSIALTCVKHDVNQTDYLYITNHITNIDIPSTQNYGTGEILSLLI